MGRGRCSYPASYRNSCSWQRRQSLDPVYVPRSQEDTATHIAELKREVQRIEDALIATAVRMAHLPARVIQKATAELEAQHALAEDRLTMGRRIAEDEAMRERQRAAIQDLVDRVNRGMRTLTLDGQRRLYTAEATGIERVQVVREVPLHLEVHIRNLDPMAAVGPSGNTMTLPMP